MKLACGKEGRRRGGWWWWWWVTAASWSLTGAQERASSPSIFFLSHAKVLLQPSRCAPGHAPYQIKGSVDGVDEALV